MSKHAIVRHVRDRTMSGNPFVSPNVTVMTSNQLSRLGSSLNMRSMDSDIVERALGGLDRVSNQRKMRDLALDLSARSLIWDKAIAQASYQGTVDGISIEIVKGNLLLAKTRALVCKRLMRTAA
jgi:hypothetical protein